MPAGPRKNDFGLSLVWTVMMLVAGSYEGTGLEETLRAVDEPDVGRRFVRLAGGELDRAYRLAGLILGDRSAAEDAVQDASRGHRAIVPGQLRGREALMPIAPGPTYAYSLPLMT